MLETHHWSRTPACEHKHVVVNTAKPWVNTLCDEPQVVTLHTMHQHVPQTPCSRRHAPRDMPRTPCVMLSHAPNDTPQVMPLTPCVMFGRTSTLQSPRNTLEQTCRSSSSGSVAPPTAEWPSRGPRSWSSLRRSFSTHMRLELLLPAVEQPPTVQRSSHRLSKRTVIFCAVP